MKGYAPYLMIQVARFGALSVSQMLRLCRGKCGRSSLYRALSELEKGDFIYPVLNPASRTRAYYATPEGRRFVFGDYEPAVSVVRVRDLDHTLISNEALIQLGQRSNVVGVSTPFEVSAEDLKRFCHDRTPDGIISLNQGGHHFELALEVENSQRSSSRIDQVLEKYSQTFRREMGCAGLVVVCMHSTVFDAYQVALKKQPVEVRERIKLLAGRELVGIREEAFGKFEDGTLAALDSVRTSSQGRICYSAIKSNAYVSQQPLVQAHASGETAINEKEF